MRERNLSKYCLQQKNTFVLMSELQQRMMNELFGTAPQHSNEGFLNSFLVSGLWSTALHMTTFLRSFKKI